MPDVLVADDDPDILMLLELSLTRDGHRVHTAQDGREAWQSLTTHSVDVAVLDVMMPHLSGLDVVSLCRAEPAFRLLPIVLLTACAQASDVARGLATGADRYLTKPFSPRQVSAVVSDLTKRRTS